MRCAWRSIASPRPSSPATAERTASCSWASSGAAPSWRSGSPRPSGTAVGVAVPVIALDVSPYRDDRGGAIDADAAAVIPNARLRAYDCGPHHGHPRRRRALHRSHGAGRARCPDGRRPAGRGAPRRPRRPRPSRAAHQRGLRGPEPAHGAGRAGRAPAGRRWGRRGRCLPAALTRPEPPLARGAPLSAACAGSAPARPAPRRNPRSASNRRPASRASRRTRAPTRWRG